MGVETKTVKGHKYYYFRYYYRMQGKKMYAETYLGSSKPTNSEEAVLRSSYKEVVEREKEKQRYNIEKSEETLPVYLL